MKIDLDTLKDIVEFANAMQDISKSDNAIIEINVDHSSGIGPAITASVVGEVNGNIVTITKDFTDVGTW